MRHGVRTAVIGAAVGLGVLLPGISPGAAPRRRAATHTVAIDATSYTPASLTVRVGDVVRWVNTDIIPHTATSKPGQFDSGTLETGDAWAFTATARGEFPYICLFHPTMKGSLRVR